jgi:hypothetical protein
LITIVFRKINATESPENLAWETPKFQAVFLFKYRNILLSFGKIYRKNNNIDKMTRAATTTRILITFTS